MKKWLLFIIPVIVLTSCHKNQPVNDSARNFTIVPQSDGYRVEVINPKNMRKTSFVLSRKPDENQLKIPVTKVACLSTTHLSYIEVLGQDSTVKAVSGKKLIYSQTYRKRINRIEEIGFEQNLDIEKIISLKPDVIFVYDLNDNLQNKFALLEKAGITVVPVYEYLENTPQGRLEWIKFFGAFFDKMEQAQNYYDSVKTRYEELANKAKNSGNKPEVLINVPFNSIWYVPAGNSYMGSFIKDAGAKYKWENTAGTGSLPLDFETVLLQAKNSDYLINPGTAESISDILAISPRMKLFKPIKTGEVYNNNKRLNKYGGSDFWESGPVHPDIILADLIKIFHPKMLEEHQLYYYKKLKK